MDLSLTKKVEVKS